MSLRQQKKQQTRDDILRTATRLLTERGFDAMRMRDVAAAAKVSYQTLYNYFPNKAQIVQALLMQDVDGISHQFAELIATYERGLLDALEAIAQMRIDVVRRHDRALWVEVLIELYTPGNEHPQVYIALEQTSHRLLSQLLDKAQASGELAAEVDTELMARTLFAQSEFAFIEFALNEHITLATVLERTNAMAALLVRPYLRQ